MASPEENLALSLERAATARASGNESRALGWEAAAGRYQTIINSKAKIATAAKNIETIREKLVSPSPVAAVPIAANPTKNPVVDSSGDSLGNSLKSVPVLNTTSIAVPTTTPPTPTIAPVVSTPPPAPAKTASIDTVLFNSDLVPIEIMTDLIFENIGGQELINIVRNDIINGQKISYSPIKNLTSIQQQYNPNNIVSLQATSNKYFANFSIKFDEKVPSVGNGPNGKNVYIEEETGDLIIETINTNTDEQVDIQIVISGTIYEADI